MCSRRGGLNSNGCLEKDAASSDATCPHEELDTLLYSLKENEFIHAVVGYVKIALLCGSLKRTYMYIHQNKLTDVNI